MNHTYPEDDSPRLDWKNILLVAIPVLLVLVGAIGWFTGFFGPRIQYPEVVLLEDFQSKTDRELTSRLSDLESTGITDFVDQNILRPILDDPTTLTLMHHAIELGEDQLSRRKDLHRIVDDCARILQIDKPRVFIVSNSDVNAYTTNVADPVLVLNSRLLEVFETPGELRFIVGHEMGHIRCEHVRAQLLLRSMLLAFRGILPETINQALMLPFLQWARVAEASADNAGLICCQDLETAETALVRLCVGLRDESTGKIDVDAFLRQSEDADVSRFSQISLLWSELQSSHPFVPHRIRELRKYAETRNYKHLWEG